MKIYSPSSTKVFMECPYKWFLKRQQGYESRYYTKRDVAASLGAAFGKAMEVFYNTNQKLTVEDITTVAQTELLRHHLESKGTREVNDEVYAKKEEYYNTLPRMIQTYMTSPDKIPADWNVLVMEGLVGDDHEAYIDMGGEDELGKPWFLDFKVKSYCAKNQIPWQIKRFAYDWQMLHYAWAYSQKIEKFVDTYYIGMMVATPTPHFVRQVFHLREEHILTWLDTAQWWWSKMEECERSGYYPMSANHHTQFGPCPYIPMCFEEGGANGYVKIEKRKR